jgi:hypothetical protein
MAKSKIPSKAKEIIPMFQVDYIDKIPYIRVPFRFGCAFQNKLVNREPGWIDGYTKIEYIYFHKKLFLLVRYFPVQQLTF